MWLLFLLSSIFDAYLIDKKQQLSCLAPYSFRFMCRCSRTIAFRKFVLNFYVHMYTREFVHIYSVWREWYDNSSPISLQEFKAWHQRKFYCFNNMVKVLSLQRATSVWDSTRVRVFQPWIKEENQWTFLAICFSIGLWFPFWTIFEVFLLFIFR